MNKEPPIERDEEVIGKSSVAGENETKSRS